MGTRIEWTNSTWSPIVGCDKISTGCAHCYAEQFAKRLVNNPNPKIADKYMSVISPNGWTGRINFKESELDKPLKWKKPRMIFVCSMGDLFHESVPFEWIGKIFSKMIMCEWHTFQVLTKRPGRIIDYLKWYWEEEGYTLQNMPELPSNIWIGVTAENQEQANKRIPILLQIPAKVHFISAEPLLNNIDLEKYWLCRNGNEYPFRSLSEEFRTKYIDLLDWVIAGPETGPGKRPMKKEWIESLYDQCKAANVPFFDKRNTLGLNIQNYPM